MYVLNQLFGDSKLKWSRCRFRVSRDDPNVCKMKKIAKDMAREGSRPDFNPGRINEAAPVDNDFRRGHFSILSGGLGREVNYGTKYTENRRVDGRRNLQ